MVERKGLMSAIAEGVAAKLFMVIGEEDIVGCGQI